MKYRSLKFRFTATIAVAYVILGLLSLLAFRLITHKIVTSLGTRFATKQALLERSKLMSDMEHDLVLSRKMAGSPLLNRWARDEGNQTLRTLALEELESYRRMFRGKSLFFAPDKSKHYYFLDGSKDAPFDRPRYTLNAATPNDIWYFRTIGSSDGFELNVDYNVRLDITRVWFNVVITPDGKTRQGVGGGGLDITRFINETVKADEPGVETILIDEKGVIEAHRDRQYVLRNSRAGGTAKKVTVYDLLSGAADQAALKQAMEGLAHGGREVETLYLTMGGRRYLAAVARLKELKWFNLVLVDAAHVVSYRDFLPILATSTVSLLAITLIIGILLNRLILARLSALAASSEQIASGNFDITMPVKAADEIGALTRSFNDMARMVKDHTENLEQKVNDRTEELHQANQRLAETNAQILDSIRYAQLIQASILPDEAAIGRNTREFFALYRPRDVVGGDFYCLRERGEHCVIAVIDCMGHGVPGAFMTMTANAVLDPVLDTIGAQDPAAILRELDRRLRATLHRGAANSPVESGLDIGLCCWTAATRRLVFAGARMDLHYAVGGSLHTVPGDRRPIGYRDASSDFTYTNHPVEAGEDALFYLASDGILDQSGGPKGLGLGRRRFGELLQSLGGLPAAERRAALEQALAEYQGGSPQRDDITVIGFRC